MKQARLQGALGVYFASPVGSDDKIYLGNQDGFAVVPKAGGQWEILAVNELDAGINATPALADDRIYFRTFSALYCFAKK